MVAIEIKSGDNTVIVDIAPQKALRNRFGSLFIAGLVFRLGPVGYTVDDRIHILPTRRLWT